MYRRHFGKDEEGIFEANVFGLIALFILIGVTGHIINHRTVQPYRSHIDFVDRPFHSDRSDW
jgi:hypothetical protein